MFGRRQKKYEKDSLELINKLNGCIVKYVTRREPDRSEESIIGKSGRIVLQDGNIIIVCDGAEVFKCRADDAECAELLSLNGVTIRGIDMITGKRLMITAYYKYYR